MPDEQIDLVGSLNLDLSKAERQIRSLESRSINLRVNGAQPLGQLTGNVSEFEKSLGAANARVIAFGASASVIAGVTLAIREMVAQTINVEKELTNINVLLHTSSQGLKDFGSSLFDIAKSTGSSFAQVAEAAKAYAQQGLTIEETTKRTASAMVLARLSGLSATESVRTLTTALNAFNREGITQEQIVQRLASINGAFAVSLTDLTDGLTRVGSLAEDAGVKFNQMAGIIAGAQQLTGRGGNNIGQAFSQIFTRLQRKDTLDSFEDIGIAVKDMTGKTLPALDILTQFAQRYDTLTASQKVFFSEMVGGVRNLNVLKTELKDLDGQNSITQRAIENANQASDQATTRSASLNKTLSAEANAALQNITKLAAASGNLVFRPTAERLVGQFNNFANTISNPKDEGTKVGVSIGAAILQGIGNALSGPGLALGTVLFAKILVNFTAFTAEASQKILGIGQASEKVRTVQSGINQLISETPGLQQKILSNTVSLAEKEALVLDLIRQQIVAREQFNATNLAISEGVVASGVRVNSGGTFTSKAGGYIPASHVISEIAGAEKAGYNISPNEVRSMRAKINGRVTDVVYNTKEKVIDNYMGSGEPAIIPPNGHVNGAGGLIGEGAFRRVFAHPKGVLSQPKSLEEMFSLLKKQASSSGLEEQLGRELTLDDARGFHSRELNIRPQLQKLIGQKGLGPKVFKINKDGSYIAERINSPTLSEALRLGVITPDEAAEQIRNAKSSLEGIGIHASDLRGSNIAFNANTGRSSILDFAGGFNPMKSDMLRQKKFLQPELSKLAKKFGTSDLKLQDLIQTHPELVDSLMSEYRLGYPRNAAESRNSLIAGFEDTQFFADGRLGNFSLSDIANAKNKTELKQIADSLGITFDIDERKFSKAGMPEAIRDVQKAYSRNVGSNIPFNFPIQTTPSEEAPEITAASTPIPSALETAKARSDAYRNEVNQRYVKIAAQTQPIVEHALYSSRDEAFSRQLRLEKAQVRGVQAVRRIQSNRNPDLLSQIAPSASSLLDYDGDAQFGDRINGRIGNTSISNNNYAQDGSLFQGNEKLSTGEVENLKNQIKQRLLARRGSYREEAKYYQGADSATRINDLNISANEYARRQRFQRFEGVKGADAYIYGGITGNQPLERSQSLTSSRGSQESSSRERIAAIEQQAAQEEQSVAGRRKGNSSQALFGLGFALPFIGGAAANYIEGRGGENNQLLGRSIEGSTNAIGTGLAVGGTIGGPWGAAIGGIIGVFGTLKSVIDNCVPSFKDLADASAEINDKYQQQLNGISAVLQAQANLADGIKNGGSKSDITGLQNQYNSSLESLPPEVKARIADAHGDIGKIKQVFLDTQQKQAEDVGNADVLANIVKGGEGNTFLGSNRAALKKYDSSSILGGLVGFEDAVDPLDDASRNDVVKSILSSSVGRKTSGKAFDQISADLSKLANAPDNTEDANGGESDRESSIRAQARFAGFTDKQANQLTDSYDNDSAIKILQDFVQQRKNLNEKEKEANDIITKSNQNFKVFITNLNDLIRTTDSSRAVKFGGQEDQQKSLFAGQESVNAFNSRYQNYSQNLSDKASFEQQKNDLDTATQLRAQGEEARKAGEKLSENRFQFSSDADANSVNGLFNQLPTADNPTQVLQDIVDKLSSLESQGKINRDTAADPSFKELGDIKEVLSNIKTNSEKIVNSSESTSRDIKAAAAREILQLSFEKASGNFGGIGAASAPLNQTQSLTGQRAEFDLINENNNPRFQTQKALGIIYAGTIDDSRRVAKGYRDSDTQRQYKIGAGIIEDINNGAIPKQEDIDYAAANGATPDQIAALTSQKNTARDRLAGSILSGKQASIRARAGATIDDLIDSLKQNGLGGVDGTRTFNRLRLSASEGNFGDVSDKLGQLRGSVSPRNQALIDEAQSQISNYNAQEGAAKLTSGALADREIGGESGPLTGTVFKAGIDDLIRTIQGKPIVERQDTTSDINKQLAQQQSGQSKAVVADDFLKKLFERDSNANTTKGNDVAAASEEQQVKLLVSGDHKVSAQVEVLYNQLANKNNGLISNNDLEVFRNQLQVWVKEFFETGGKVPPTKPVPPSS